MDTNKPYIEMSNIDPVKSAITSIASAFAGTLSNFLTFIPVGFVSIETANIFFQHAAWTVAIIAGIVSIINGVRNWKVFKKRVK